MKSGELVVAGAVLALGLVFALGVALVPEAAGYAQVGPRVFPGIVAAGLVTCGLLLGVQAWRGGFSRRIVAEVEKFDARAFVWIVAALGLQLVLIGTIGFIAASVLLFMMVAHALGSRSRIRDAVVGTVLAAALYVLFTQVLGLALGPRVLGI